MTYIQYVIKDKSKNLYSSWEQPYWVPLEQASRYNEYGEAFDDMDIRNLNEAVFAVEITETITEMKELDPNE